MAGPTTAQRGAPGRTDTSARPPHIGPEGPRIGRRLLLVLIGAAAALLTAFVVWALYGSSWFRVAEVRTSGVEVLSREEVEAAAATPLGAPSSPWTPMPWNAGCARSCLVSTQSTSFGHGRTASALR